MGSKRGKNEFQKVESYSGRFWRRGRERWREERGGEDEETAVRGSVQRRGAARGGGFGGEEAAR